MRCVVPPDGHGTRIRILRGIVRRCNDHLLEAEKKRAPFKGRPTPGPAHESGHVRKESATPEVAMPEIATPEILERGGSQEKPISVFCAVVGWVMAHPLWFLVVSSLPSLRMIAEFAYCSLRLALFYRICVLFDAFVPMVNQRTRFVCSSAFSQDDGG